MFKFIQVQRFAKSLFSSDKESQKAGEIIEDEGEGYLKIIEKLEEAKVI